MLHFRRIIYLFNIGYGKLLAASAFHTYKHEVSAVTILLLANIFSEHILSIKPPLDGYMLQDKKNRHYNRNDDVLMFHFD